MAGNKKGSFSLFPLIFYFNYISVKIIVRIEVARLQVWGNLFILCGMLN